MSICYALIIRQLRKTQARHSFVTACKTPNSSDKGKSRRTLSAAALKSERNFRRVNIICVALVLLFAICWLPFHSYHLARRIGIKGSVSVTCSYSLYNTVCWVWLSGGSNQNVQGRGKRSWEINFWGSTLFSDSDIFILLERIKSNYHGPNSHRFSSFTQGYSGR